MPNLLYSASHLLSSPSNNLEMNMSAARMVQVVISVPLIVIAQPIRVIMTKVTFFCRRQVFSEHLSEYGIKHTITGVHA